MKKCCIYLDAIDNATADDGSVWQDVLMHASRCPDCASDMKRRSEILEMLAEMPEPSYPGVLHSAIMSGIADTISHGEGDAEPGILSRFFERLLQPLELAVSAACLVMFVFLMQIDHSSPLEIRTSRSAVGKQITAVAGQNQAVSSQTLETVSVAEVNRFLQQLEEFNRSHREQRQPQIDYTPELRLVNDLSNRR